MKEIKSMTPEEFQRYGRNRVKMMLKMRNQAEMWLQQKDTPMQRLVLQTAENHLRRAEDLSVRITHDRLSAYYGI